MHPSSVTKQPSKYSFLVNALLASTFSKHRCLHHIESGCFRFYVVTRENDVCHVVLCGGGRVVAFSSLREFAGRFGDSLPACAYLIFSSFFFLFSGGDQLTHTKPTSYVRIGPQWLSELRRLVLCINTYICNTNWGSPYWILK